MKEVFIEFTRPKNRVFPVYSWLIRAVECSEYSHVRIRWFSRAGVELIYEAGGTAVRLIGEKAQNKHQVEVVHSVKFDVTKEEYRRLIGLFRFAGVDYGVKQALGIALARIFNLKHNPFANGRKSQVCSELVGVFLEEVLGYNIDLNLELAGPKDIYEWLSKR